MTYEPISVSAELLKLRGDAQADLHARAAHSASGRFGQRVFLRGVVEVSNHCRENCVYCGMRRDNQALARFRAHYEQLAEFLIHHRPASITDLNIQTGDSLQFKVFAAENIYPQTGLRDLKYCTEGYLISGFVTGQQSYFAVLDTNGNVSTSVPTVSAPTMNVFNNPTSNQFSVELVGEKTYLFTLTDALGKIIEVKKGNGKMNFNIQNYAAGSYFLNVTGDQVKREVVIIKQ